MDRPEPTELDKFKQAARDLDCDDDEARFRERVGKLVKAKPADKIRDG
jgi:hypothetical protein